MENNNDKIKSVPSVSSEQTRDTDNKKSVQSVSSLEIRDADKKGLPAETQEKAGYKKTKRGWIPEEWEIISLSDLSSRIGDGIHSTPKYDDNGEFYFVNGNNLINGKIVIDEKTKKTSREEFETHKRPIDSTSTIFLSINGTIGNISFYNNETIVLGKSAAYINCTSDINKLFLFYSLQGERIKNYFENELTGSTIRNLSLKSIRSTPIFTPPLPEQKKIAQILSTWDKGITKLEQLISQKQLLKKGLMQQLLTGKKRFAEFVFNYDSTDDMSTMISKKEKGNHSPSHNQKNHSVDDWKVVKLKDVLKIGSGKDYKHLDKGEIPVYGTGGLMTFVNEYLYDGTSVGIGRKGTIDKPVLLKGKFWTVDTLFYTHSFENTIPEYIYYLFLTINWKLYNEASGLPSLSKSTIEQIKIKLPTSIEEQIKVAAFLSSADREIKQLQNQLTKLQEQKKGLMQKLLTGEVRVKL